LQGKKRLPGKRLKRLQEKRICKEEAVEAARKKAEKKQKPSCERA